MKTYTFNDIHVPFFVEKEDSLIEANDAFLSLSGYSRTDLIGKPFNTVWSDLLRINKDPLVLDAQQEVFLFTKSIEARCIGISVNKDMYSGATAYFFKEIPDSRFDDKNQFVSRMISDNNIGIGVYTAPDFTLIKANQTYLNCLPVEFNTKELAYGKCVSTFFENFIGSSTEKLLIDLVENNKSKYTSEMHGLIHGNKYQYFNTSIIPISERGIVKYIIFMLNDVSDLIDLSNDAIFAWELNGAIIYWNKGAERYYGYSSKEAVGSISHDLLKTVFPVKFDAFKQELEHNQIWNGELVHTRKNGTTIIVDSKQQIIVDKHGRKIILESNHDITKHKEQEIEVKRQAEQLKVIIENSTDGISVVDKNGNYLLVNETIRKAMEQKSDIGIVNMRAGESIALGQKYLDEHGNELLITSLPNIRVLKGERVENQRVVMKKGESETHYNISATPVFDEKGDFQFGVITSHDVTKMVQKDREIRKQKKELQIIIENISDAITIYDKNGNEIRINEVGKDLQLEYGLGHDSIKKRYDENPPYDSLGNVFPFEKMPAIRLINGERFTNVHMTYKLHNKILHLEVRGTPIYDKDGNFIMGILVCNNITEQVEKEKQLKLEKEKQDALEASMKLKDEFLYLITHEFRTPMAVVNSALQAIDLIYKKDITENVSKHLKTIKQNTNRQLRLVNNLLDITRMNSGNIKLNKCSFDIVYVTNAIVNSIELYASQKKVNVSFTSSITKKTVYLDEEKYERIILNLMSNALKFTPKYKNISVSLSLKKYANRSMVCITIKDEGIGIPKDKQQIIFDRFGQADTSLSRQAEGTGLGLYLAKLMVNALEGDILLESEVDKGSTFTVLLPIVKPAVIDKVAVATEFDNPFMNNDSRIIQTATIEFSDIYFD